MAVEVFAELAPFFAFTDRLNANMVNESIMKPSAVYYQIGFKINRSWNDVCHDKKKNIRIFAIIRLEIIKLMMIRLAIIRLTIIWHACYSRINIKSVAEISKLESPKSLSIKIHMYNIVISTNFSMPGQNLTGTKTHPDKSIVGKTAPVDYHYLRPINMTYKSEL